MSVVNCAMSDALGTTQTLTETGVPKRSADINSFNCQYCSKILPTYVGWRSHLKVHKNEKVFQCIQNSCSRTFPDVDSFLAHIKDEHGDHTKYNCHLCFETFSSLNKLGLHKCNNNNNDKVAEKSPCEKCGTKLISGKPHVCNEFSCSVCQRSFHSERFLRRHLPIHDTVASHVCTVCDKAFKTAKSLSVHQVVHSNLKPFTCPTCSAAFSRREKLVRHRLIHDSAKKFQCPYSKILGCPRSFYRRDKLKMHLWVHDPSRRPNKNKSELEQSEPSTHLNDEHISPSSPLSESNVLHDST